MLRYYIQFLNKRPGPLIGVLQYRVSHKKDVNKKLSVGAVHAFNFQVLNLFGFSLSVSFVWCII